MCVSQAGLHFVSVCVYVCVSQAGLRPVSVHAAVYGSVRVNLLSVF